MPKKKPKTSFKRQEAKGLKCVVVWMTVEEKGLLKVAAAKSRRSMTQFVVEATVEAATKLMAQP